MVDRIITIYPAGTLRPKAAVVVEHGHLSSEFGHESLALAVGDAWAAYRTYGTTAKIMLALPNQTTVEVSPQGEPWHVHARVLTILSDHN